MELSAILLDSLFSLVLLAGFLVSNWTQSAEFNLDFCFVEKKKRFLEHYLKICHSDDDIKNGPNNIR